jgi:signal transduction histidine kinase
VGIPAADLKHIWWRFYRASMSRRGSPRCHNGAGLGLAITRGIIESHGGAVAASSVPGNTTIVLRLPLAST